MFSLNRSKLPVTTGEKMIVPVLWKALLSGEYEAASQLIHIGDNVNEIVSTENDNQTTFLHYAVFKKSSVQCIRVLRKFGANFNALDSKKRTPLHWAALHHAHPEVVEMLINGGAVVDARDAEQRTPLHLAVEQKLNDTAQTLIARGASIDAADRMRSSTLHKAVFSENLSMVQILISHKVNIDPRDVSGSTPLLYYVVQPNNAKTEIIQLLLDNGADVNAKDCLGQFPLLQTTVRNHLASSHLLLSRGARVNEATNDGETALHCACEHKLVDVTALLLEFGADLSARNHSQRREAAFELIPSEETAEIIIKEAVKRELLGQSLYKGYKEMAQACRIYVKFDNECREEIQKMQSKKIDAEDSQSISFFQIFSMDEGKLAALAGNEKFVTAFESSGYVALFRIYASELTEKFEAAKKRANYLMIEDCLGHALADTLCLNDDFRVKKIPLWGKISDDRFLKFQGGWGHSRPIYSAKNLYI